jgi:O-antigen ligase
MTAVGTLPVRLALRPVHLAAVAMALAILFSPVSQLTPRGGFEKMPMLAEVLLLLAVLGRWLLAGLRPPPVPTLVWLALVILHAMATGLWAIDERIFVTYGLRALHASLWAFGIYAAIEDREDLLTMLRALHGIGCAASLVGIAQFLLPALQADFTRENTEGALGAALRWDDELGAGSIVRVTGTLAHPLGLALALGCILPWTPAIWQATRSNSDRLLLLTSTAVQLVALALTYSRMAVVGLGLTTVLYVLRGGVRHRGAVLTGLACASLTMLPLLPATMVERMFDPTHFRESDSLIARMEMQVYGSDLGMQHGFFGIGYGCYGNAYEATAKGRYVEQARWMMSQDDWASYDLGDIGGHNTYLEVWVEQGLLGLALVAAMLFTLVRDLWRPSTQLPRGSLDRNLGLCCEAGLIALLASTVVIHLQEALPPWTWLGLACAWVGLQRRAPEAP